MIRQLPENDFKTELLIIPRGHRIQVEATVQDCLGKWSHRYPGLSVNPEKNALLINIPYELRTTHEQHFCQVRDAFLANLDAAIEPAEHRACTIAKYSLLAEAREKALTSPFEMLK